METERGLLTIGNARKFARELTNKRNRTVYIRLLPIDRISPIDRLTKRKYGVYDNNALNYRDAVVEVCAGGKRIDTSI